MNDQFGSLGGFLATVKATLFSRYPDEGALRLLDEEPAPHSLVQIENSNQELVESRL